MNTTEMNAASLKKCALKDRSIVHIANDGKFIDMAMDMFESVLPGKNALVLNLYWRKDGVVKHVRRKPDVITNDFGKSFFQLRTVLSRARVVVVHSREVVSRLLLALIPADCPRIWIGWGYDYQEFTLSAATELYGIRTAEWAKASWTYKELTRALEKKEVGARAVVRKFLFGRPVKSSVFDLFCPVLPDEYDVIKKRCPNFTPEYQAWNYGDCYVHSIPGSVPAVRNDIYIGNSLSWTSNHLDVFALLEGSDLWKNRQIIVPLSYGDPSCLDVIVQAGVKAFGDRFVPMTDFLPRKEYFSRLSGCGIAIFGHYRQQAMGNVFAFLQAGAVVVVSEKNPAWEFFTRRGAIICSLEAMEKDPSSLRLSLTAEEIAINKKVVFAHLSPTAVKAKTIGLIARALSLYGRRKMSKET